MTNVDTLFLCLVVGGFTTFWLVLMGAWLFVTVLGDGPA